MHSHFRSGFQGQLILLCLGSIGPLVIEFIYNYPYPCPYPGALSIIKIKKKSQIFTLISRSISISKLLLLLFLMHHRNFLSRNLNSLLPLFIMLKWEISLLAILLLSLIWRCRLSSSLWLLLLYLLIRHNLLLLWLLLWLNNRLLWLRLNPFLNSSILIQWRFNFVWVHIW